MPGGFGPSGHRKKHAVDSLINHSAVAGAVGGNIVTIDPITLLPIKDSGTSLASILGGLIPQGLWNASTNTPALADGIGTLSHFYLVSVAGTQDLGSGSQDFNVNDWVLYDQNNEWKKVDHTDEVNSIFGRTGDVIAVVSDYDASQIDNDSGVSGAFVSDALDNLKTSSPIIKVVLNVISAPPLTPIMNGWYAIQNTPSGAWGGHPGELAQWTGSWQFQTPADGDVIYAYNVLNPAPRTKRFLTSNLSNTTWELLEKYYAHSDMVNVSPGDHHARYLDSEAVTAMGVKADGNPLNHDRYTDAEAQAAVQYHADVSLAGVAPVDADVSTWADGDRGHGIGTGAREFYMVKRGTAVKYVEMS